MPKIKETLGIFRVLKILDKKVLVRCLKCGAEVKKSLQVIRNIKSSGDSPKFCRKCWLLPENSIAFREKLRAISLGRKAKPPIHFGNAHKLWKGNDVSYNALHGWLRRHYGPANKCENKSCKNKGVKMFHWANISGEYKRDRSDFKMLCCSCHKIFDMGSPNTCRRGHPYTQENTYLSGKYKTQKNCRTCQRLREVKKRLLIESNKSLDDVLKDLPEGDKEIVRKAVK